ncbi:MAG: acyl-[acyl-carrier-protein]--UDP-N-acetylglucosamine O-acyltransferase [Candidatus Omnitrophica bacterium CG1_02_49_16]|nr:MAG: acyl-[acyl-carrier-protein]--UDP-N-acetylglucosamine O-acyltransferase [Candidatus Omnitrophica bacterium CG1_02_49_16]
MDRLKKQYLKTSKGPENQSLHPTAIIGERAKLGPHVSVGPYTVIENDVSIGDESVIQDHVHIGHGTSIGKNNFIFTGAVIGHDAQNKTSTSAEGILEIGDDNIFREYVTIHRGANQGSVTRIGCYNYFMVSSHVGHDCQVKDHVTVTNAVLLGGFVTLEEYCVLGGGSAVHQFCRIGRYAMVGGHATVTKDVPPYMLLDDNESLVGSLNMVGLRRAGFSETEKQDIKRAYKLIYRSGLNITHAMEAVTRDCPSQSVAYLIAFIKASQRGILGHR